MSKGDELARARDLVLMELYDRGAVGPDVKSAVPKDELLKVVEGTGAIPETVLWILEDDGLVKATGAAGDMFYLTVDGFKEARKVSGKDKTWVRGAAQG
jgi:hypothetical protein